MANPHLYNFPTTSQPMCYDPSQLVQCQQQTQGPPQQMQPYFPSNMYGMFPSQQPTQYQMMPMQMMPYATSQLPLQELNSQPNTFQLGPTNPSTPEYVALEPHSRNQNRQELRKPYQTVSEDMDEDTLNDVFEPNEFQKIENKKRKRDKNSPQQYSKQTKIRTETNPVETQNRYSILSDKENDLETNTVDKKIINKIPPFILYGVTELAALITLIRASTSDFSYKLLTENKVKIQTNNVENYKLIKKLLDDNKIVRHTYKLPEDKMFRVVLRNMHHSTDTKDIIEALQHKGHIVKQIMNVRDRLTKIPKNLFFIDLQIKANNREIYNITNLLNANIRFEAPYKKQTIVQCKRCQNYGHTRNQCTQQYRCVKCAGYHDYRLCKKKKEDGKAAKCILCGGAHPANFKGCQVYLDIIKRRFPSVPGEAKQTQPANSKPSEQTHQTLTVTNHTLTIPEGQTYAQVTKIPQTAINTSSQTQSTVNHQFLLFLQQQNSYLQQQNLALQQQIEKQQQSIQDLTQEIKQLKNEIRQNHNFKSNGPVI